DSYEATRRMVNSCRARWRTRSACGRLFERRMPVPDDAVPGSTDLHFLSIAEAARLIERRQLSPVALTRAFLDRIAAIDPQLNAYLLVTAEQALGPAPRAGAGILAGK